jgi:hypothetical protein
MLTLCGVGSGVEQPLQAGKMHWVYGLKGSKQARAEVPLVSCLYQPLLLLVQDVLCSLSGTASGTNTSMQNYFVLRSVRFLYVGCVFAARLLHAAAVH